MANSHIFEVVKERNPYERLLHPLNLAIGATFLHGSAFDLW